MNIFSSIRMSPIEIEKLLSFVSKKSTATRNPISPSERLAVTLRYLVTGDAQCFITEIYRINRLSRKPVMLSSHHFKEWIILIVHQILMNGKVLLKNLKVNGIFHTQLLSLWVIMWSCSLPIIVVLHILITRKHRVLCFLQFVTLSMSL